jgi:hypothetical protein
VAEVKGFWEKQGGAKRRFDLTPVPVAYTVTFRDGGAVDSVHLGALSIASHLNISSSKRTSSIKA